jgi:hypothetical protein
MMLIDLDQQWTRLTTGDLKEFCLRCTVPSCNRVRCGAPGYHHDISKVARRIRRNGKVIGRIVRDDIDGKFVVDQLKFGMFIEIGSYDSFNEAWHAGRTICCD